MINRLSKLPKNNSFFLFGPRQTGKSTLIHEIFSKETLQEYNFLQTDTYLRYLGHPSHLREEILQRSSKITHVLLDEIEVEAQVRRLDTFARFLNLATFGNGQVVHYTNIASDVGVSSNTVKQYYQILVDTLLGTLLQPYRKSWRKRLSQHPRFYFFDTGVIRALKRQLNISLEPKTPAYGNLFESWVVNELFRMNSCHQLDWDFSYYRTEAGAEVDVVIETPKGEMIVVKIKSKDQINSSNLRGLRSFSEVCPKAKLVCICSAPHSIRQNEVRILPWQKMNEFFKADLSQV